MPINEEVIIHFRGTSQNVEREIDNVLSELDRLEQFYINLNKRLGELGTAQRNLLSGISGPETQQAVTTARQIDSSFQKAESSIRSADEALDDFAASRPEPVQLVAGNEELREALQNYDKLSDTKPPEPAKLIQESAPEIREKGRAAAEAVRNVRNEENIGLSTPDTQQAVTAARQVDDSFQKTESSIRSADEALDDFAANRSEPVGLVADNEELREALQNYDKLSATRPPQPAKLIEESAPEIREKGQAATQAVQAIRREDSESFEQLNRSLFAQFQRQRALSGQFLQPGNQLRDEQRRLNIVRAIGNLEERVNREALQAGQIELGFRDRSFDLSRDELDAFQQRLTVQQNTNNELDTFSRRLTEIAQKERQGQEERVRLYNQRTEANRGIIQSLENIERQEESGIFQVRSFARQEQDVNSLVRSFADYAQQLRLAGEEERRLGQSQVEIENDNVAARRRRFVQARQEFQARQAILEVEREISDIRQPDALGAAVLRQQAEQNQRRILLQKEYDQELERSQDIEKERNRLAGEYADSFDRYRQFTNYNRDLGDVIRENNIELEQTSRIFRQLRRPGASLADLNLPDLEAIDRLVQVSGRDLAQLDRQFRDVEERAARLGDIEVTTDGPSDEDLARLRDYVRQNRELGVVLRERNIDQERARTLFRQIDQAEISLGDISDEDRQFLASIQQATGRDLPELNRQFQLLENRSRRASRALILIPTILSRFGDLTRHINATVIAMTHILLITGLVYAALAALPAIIGAVGIAITVLGTVAAARYVSGIREAVQATNLWSQEVQRAHRVTSQLGLDLDESAERYAEAQSALSRLRFDPNNRALASLGINLREISREGDFTQNALYAISQAVSGLNEIQQLNILRKIFGDNDELIALLISGRYASAVDEISVHLRNLGEGDFRNIERVERGLNRIVRVASAELFGFVSDTSPAIDDLFDGIERRIPQVANALESFFVPRIEYLGSRFDLIWERGRQFLQDARPTIDRIGDRLEQTGALFRLPGLTGPQVVDTAAILLASHLLTRLVAPLTKIGSIFGRLAIALSPQGRIILGLLSVAGILATPTIGRGVDDFLQNLTEARTLEEQLAATDQKINDLIAQRTGLLVNQATLQAAQDPFAQDFDAAQQAALTADPQTTEDLEAQIVAIEKVRDAIQAQIDAQAQLERQAQEEAARLDQQARDQQAAIDEANQAREDELALSRKLRIEEEETAKLLRDQERTRTRLLRNRQSFVRDRRADEDLDQQLRDLGSNRDELQKLLDSYADVQIPPLSGQQKTLEGELGISEGFTANQEKRLSQYEIALGRARTALDNIFRQQVTDRDQFVFDIAPQPTTQAALEQLGLTINDVSRTFQEFALTDPNQLQKLADLEKEIQRIERAFMLTREEIFRQTPEGSLLDQVINQTDRALERQERWLRLGQSSLQQFNSTIANTVTGITSIGDAFENLLRQLGSRILETAFDDLTSGLQRRLNELIQAASERSGPRYNARIDTGIQQGLLNQGIQQGGSQLQRLLQARLTPRGKANASIYNEINVYGNPDPTAVTAGVENANNRWLDTPQGRAFLGSQVEEESR